MSQNMIVAKRYARALFEISTEQNEVLDVQEQLKDVLDSIQANLELEQFLNFPNIENKAKSEIIKQVFPDLKQSVFNTLRLLLDRQRQTILPELYEAYVRIAEEALGQATALVSSSLPLSEADMNQVAQTLGKLTGKKISVQTQLDPALLGGLRVRIGDRLYDGSLVGKLNRLGKTLKQSQAL